MTARESIENLWDRATPVAPLLDAYRAEVLAEAETKAREVVARLWKDGTTQQQLDRAGGARAVEWEIGLMARGIDEPVPAPDFFQPGHTYTRMHRGIGIEFRVCSIDTSPDGSQRVARGWRIGDYGTRWEPTDSDDINGWTEVTAEATS